MLFWIPSNFVIDVDVVVIVVSATTADTIIAIPIETTQLLQMNTFREPCTSEEISRYH